MGQQPTMYDVHVNRPLTNISVAYLQDQKIYVADKVFPVVPVAKQSDRYFVYLRGNMIRDSMRIRAAGRQSAGTGWNLDSSPSYFANVRALHHDVPDQIRANSDQPLNPDADATRFLTQLSWLSKENVFTTNFFNTGIWSNADQVGVAGAPGVNQFMQWNNTASTPIEDIRAQMTVMQQNDGGFRPNKLVLGRQVADKLYDHPDIIDRVKAGQTPNHAAIGNDEALAFILGLDEVIVMDAVQNTGPETNPTTVAADNAASVNSFIGGKNALLVYAAPSPGLMVPSAGYTFTWTGWFGAEDTGIRMKSFRMEPEAQTRIEIENAFDMKPVCLDMGVFFSLAVA